MLFQISVKLQLRVGDREVRRVLLFNPIKLILGPDFLAQYEKSLTLTSLLLPNCFSIRLSSDNLDIVIAIET